MLGNFLKSFFKYQQPFGLGAFPNAPDERDIKFAAVSPEQKKIPSKHINYIEDLPVFNQGSFGTCVAHAMATMRMFQEKADDGSVESVSRRFTYAIGRREQGFAADSAEGLYPRPTAKILKDIGCVWEVAGRDNDAVASHAEYCSYVPSQQVLDMAGKRKIKGYVFVDRDEDELKRAIFETGLVTATLAYDSRAWRSFRLGEIKNISGYHHVGIYGYEEVGDDTLFFFRNSWGKSWGNNGNGVFRWSLHAKHLYDIQGYTDIPNELLEEAHNQSYKFLRDLRIGMSGEDVRKLQERLVKEGLFNHSVTSYFGNITRESVKEFQRKNGLLPDGEVGPATRGKLNGSKTTLLEALIQVESQGNDNAVGDLNLTHKAYGCLQIRQPYVDDVNRKLGTNYRAQQCLGNRELSIFLFDAYMEIYATRLAMGREPTNEDKARIHNGGPAGWKRSVTIPYWEKVKKLLA